MCLDQPPSLSSQTIPTPATVRCVREQGFSFPTPMYAVPPHQRQRNSNIPMCRRRQQEDGLVDLAAVHAGVQLGHDPGAQELSPAIPA